MPTDLSPEYFEDGRVGELVNGVDVGVAGEPQGNLVPPSSCITENGRGFQHRDGNHKE